MSMYELWGRRLKQLNRASKRWMREEKEKKETEVYVDLLDLKRNHVLPALRLYHHLMQQEFVRYSDERQLFEKVNFAVRTNSLRNIPLRSRQILGFHLMNFE